MLVGACYGVEQCRHKLLSIRIGDVSIHVYVHDGFVYIFWDEAYILLRSPTSTVRKVFRLQASRVKTACILV